MYSYLVLSPYLTVKMEYPVEKGYIDIAIFRRYNDVPYESIIEVKYIKQNEFSEEKLKRKIKESREQIERYKKSYELNYKKIKKYIVIFVGKEVKYIEEME
ncbi:PD-(D/E)XK nuclease domain-containing protein [Marinitoga lauensis]|uniref:PD-(D/E)XK nuclease domain-containing protein n=1 Tax=Marinitoga lauensis TaxID=2201189 RepID=UPI001F0EBFDC|nr:PD-(D/E)XK nuclease domain-containing protein [Marinitoga lauensis]